MKIINQFLLLTLSFTLTIVCLDFFIQNANIASLSYAEFYEDIGKGIPKSKTFVNFNEGFGIVTTNKSRYVGENVTLKKERKTIRIVLIGDSYVESIQVFERHYFGNIAKKILAKRFPNTKFELLNFGRSHFNIGNMYAYEKLIVQQFNPDYILYFLSEDDLAIDNSVITLHPTTSLTNNNLSINQNYNTGKLKKYNRTKILYQNSALYNLFNSCRIRFSDGKTASIILGDFNFFKEGYSTAVRMEKANFLNPITEQIINNFNSNIIVVNRDNTELPAYFLNKCNEKGIVYWSLSNCLNSLEKKVIHPNYWNVTNRKGHWNQYAHKAIGEELAKKIMSIIINNNQHTHQKIKHDI